MLNFDFKNYFNILESTPVLSMEYVVYALWVLQIIDELEHDSISHDLVPIKTAFCEQFVLFNKKTFFSLDNEIP